MTALSEHPLFVASRGRDLVAIAPMRHLPRVIAETGATHLVSVLNAHLIPPTPPGIEPHRHLKLAVSDHAHSETDGGSRHPFAERLEELLDFAESWDRETPMLIHCFSGLNRSPAAAYLLIAAMNPETPETLVAHHLRQASDTAAPSRVMAAVGDHLLQRSGRLAAALDVIGPGAPAAEARPFLLTTVLHAPLRDGAWSNVDETRDIARE